MKQKKYEIAKKDTIEAILNRCRVGRLGTVGMDGYPYIVPVNYVYFQNSIYFHCARQGEKLDNIRRFNAVCFEVDIPLAYIDTAFAPEASVCQVSQLYQCVIVRGRAELIEDIDEKISALNALMARHENQADFSSINSDTKAVGLCEVVAVRVERLSAKANLTQNMSVEQRERLKKYLDNRNDPGDKETARLLVPHS